MQPDSLNKGSEIAGTVLVFAALGLALDRWLGTSIFGVGGMLLGVTSAIYLIWMRFIKR